MIKEKPEKLRLPAVAGQFYPDDKKELNKTIDGLLNEAQPFSLKGEVFGLLLPHAGYVFSGEVAACGVKTLEGKSFDTVIIIGDSHYEYFDGVSFWAEGEWETPLGKIKIDDKLARTVLDSSERFFERDSVHLFEHSIEVQLPFLQKTLKNFKILPIIFGSEDEDWKLLAEALFKNIKNKKILIIASADLSHYLSYDEAKEIDNRTLNNILKLQTHDLEICAKDSVKTLVEITRLLKGKAGLLKYANSGDTAAGDKEKVVGYGAMAFLKKPSERLNFAERAELLDIARKSVESFVRGEKVFKLKTDFEKLKAPSGAFVTLKVNGKLRGCIGAMETSLPLYKTVARAALAAAVQDPRFGPVAKEELEKLEYEVSVLTYPRRINSFSEIEMGKHGVVAQAGENTAVFLPQVAEETKWDKETFLNNLMLKAGLERSHWKNNPVDFYIFEAQVFNL